MSQGAIETYHQNGKWHNRVVGGTGGSGEATTHDTKAEAVRMGRDMARKASLEHVIKNMDGKIGRRNSYGNDPRNVKG
jgi:hypothetical protein